MVLTNLEQAICFSLFALIFVTSLLLNSVFLSHSPKGAYYIVFLLSFGAENAWFQLGAAAAAPAAGCDAHAALCWSLAVAVDGLQPFTV